MALLAPASPSRPTPGYARRFVDRGVGGVDPVARSSVGLVVRRRRVRVGEVGAAHRRKRKPRVGRLVQERVGLARANG